MRRIRLLIFTLLAIGLLNSCGFIGNTFTYIDTTKEFMKDLLAKDYEKCIDLMAMNRVTGGNASRNTMKPGLEDFRKVIVETFGDKLNYSFMNSEKTYTSYKEENTFPNTAILFMQIDNDKEFGVLKVWFDDKTNKIVYISTLGIKEPIPNMTTFWLFGIIVLSVVAFNIYMIVRIKRSKVTKKWKKYLAIIILNVPAIGYKAVGGFVFYLLNFQILLGMSFEKTGYLGSSWTVGIPIGSLYVLWKLTNGKYKTTDTIEPVLTTEHNTESGESGDTKTLTEEK